MTKTMQLVLAMAMVAAPMARAQQAEVQAVVPGVEMQAAQSTGGNATQKDELFAGTEKFAKGAKESSELNLDPKTMGMVPSGKDGGDLARKMRFMVIRNYTYDKPGMYSMEDVEVYRRKLNDGSWNCSIRVRDKDGSTDICSREIPGGGSEMVIIAAEPKELSFIHISGNMSLKDLQKMNGMGRLTH
jgi:hypothetical protein